MRDSGPSNSAGQPAANDDRSSGAVAEKKSRGWTPWLVHVGLLLFTAGAGTFVGSLDWSVSDVWTSFLSEESETFDLWVFLRVRRAVLAALAGAALAVSGVAFQATLRNPLAEPYLLGVSNGASLGTLVALVFLGTAQALTLPVAAFVGALVSIGLLFGIARSGRIRETTELILAGVIVNAMLGALILFLWTATTRDQAIAGLFYLMGDVDNAALEPGRILIATIAVLVGVLVFRGVARGLDLMALGDDEAFDLGIDAGKFRVLVLTVASLTTALTVAACGPIGFVGLVVPHALRRIHGPMHASLIPFAALGGATFLVLADVGARLIASGFDSGSRLPIGVVTSIVGGPFFLMLLVSRRRRLG